MTRIEVIYDNERMQWVVIQDGKEMQRFDDRSDDYAYTNASDYASWLRRQSSIQ